MEKLEKIDQSRLIEENKIQIKRIFQYNFLWHNYVPNTMLLQLFERRWKIILCGALMVFSLASISIFQSFNFYRKIYNDKEFRSLKFYRSSSGSFLGTKQSNNEFGYPVELIEDLVRDKEISFVFPVFQGDRILLFNLLRSMRNLCMDCSEVPVIVVTDDASKDAIFKTLYNDTSIWPGEAAIAQSFPKLSIKVLREVMPYYAVNKWNDNSLAPNGKHPIQSHKKMFGVINGASTRFSWVMDVDSYVFKPMSLKKVLKEYLSSPYIITSHDWNPGEGIIDCAQNLTGNFLSTGYTIEVMHWIYDREIMSDLNDLVLSQYPNWNVPFIMNHLYFVEVLYYHFIMSNQIQQRKYMQYRIIETRTLLGGNQSPLLQAVVKTAIGGLIERIGISMTKIPSIYQEVVRIWKTLKIPVYRPDGIALTVIDFAQDTDVVVFTNLYSEELYRMSQSGYWKNSTLALDNAEKQGWKSLADQLKQRNNPTEILKQKLRSL